MLTYRDLVAAFRDLDLGSAPVIVHGSLSAFGPVRGSAKAITGALLAVFSSVVMPAFTYKTMVTPEVGPPDNAIDYGSGAEANARAVFFHPDLPVDPLMGILPETLRKHPHALRSPHPIYSFVGVNADEAIQAQTIAEPFAPIEALTKAGGWVLLMGVNHTVNTSIHYGEQRAGRPQFTRWALTPQGIVECPRWPGCSFGFEQIAPRLKGATRKVQAGQALLQAVPLPVLVTTVIAMIQEDPHALLCHQPDCQRCNTIRHLTEPKRG